MIFHNKNSKFTVFSDLELRNKRLQEECARITADLQHALAVRELCCADFERARRWLQEAEVQVLGLIAK